MVHEDCLPTFSVEDGESNRVVMGLSRHTIGVTVGVWIWVLWHDARTKHSRYQEDHRKINYCPSNSFGLIHTLLRFEYFLGTLSN